MALVAMVLLAVSSCGGDKNTDPDPNPSADTTVSVTGIELNQESLRLNTGGTAQLTYVISPDSATNKTVDWSSDDESVATVSQTGLVTAIGVGLATIAITTEDGDFEATATVTVTDDVIFYEASEEDFSNPERGFYKYSSTRSNSYSPLTVNSLKNNLSGAGGYYSSLTFRYFLITEFVDGPLSQEFLDNVDADFAVAREAGVKLIPRFTYTNSVQSGDCQESWICPPYGDAPKDIVLGHIAQLGPVLSENADVLLAVQMGFIGVWGENYYTDYFGDASPNGGQNKLLDENWQDRIDVLNALLDVLPADVMVQVRYPQMKQRTIYGIDAPTNSAALTESEAFTGTVKARIGFHNDCLFASADDFGTYADYGNSSSSAGTDISNLKPYFSSEGKYVVIGGETCSDSGYSPFNDCAPTGRAEQELRDLHYTYLNADYNHEVNGDWEDGGCMGEIKRNLGYRFVLDSAELPKTASDKLDVTLYLRNVGYAAPTKERYAYLILKSASGGETSYKFDQDMRHWDGSVELTGSFDLPAASTTYELFLYFPDINASISDRPEYAIRLANGDTWDSATGMNNLNRTLSVTQ